MLLANRKMLLVKQIDIENEIRGTLRVFGLKLSGRIQQAAFERQAMELLSGHPELAAMVRPMHKMMLKAVRADDTCRRLMTIPGVGALTATTYVTTIDDPARFERSRDVGAHLGLSPRKYASGEVDRNGPISMIGHQQKAAVEGAVPTQEYRIHGRLHVVVDTADRHAAE
jgi:transposase